MNDALHGNDQVTGTMAGIQRAVDRYDRAVIRYPAGSNRCAVAFLNKSSFTSPLALGRLIFDEPYRDIAERYVYDVSFDMMQNSVVNVHGGRFPDNYRTFYQKEDAVSDINKRTYPSHPNWIYSKSGQGHMADGRCADPACFTKGMAGMLSPDREIRRKAFEELVPSKKILDRKTGICRLGDLGLDGYPRCPKDLTDSEKSEFYEKEIMPMRGGVDGISRPS